MGGVGLLWFDEDKTKSLKDKIKGGANRYKEKFGRQPKVCYLYLKTGVKKPKVKGVEVIHDSKMLPNHFLFTIDYNK